MNIEFQKWQVKALRNYFGINDKSSVEHWAFKIFDKALNSIKLTNKPPIENKDKTDLMLISYETSR